jgi:hypothetical protein
MSVAIFRETRRDVHGRPRGREIVGMYRQGHRFMCCRRWAAGSRWRLVRRYAHLSSEHQAQYVNRMADNLRVVESEAGAAVQLR